MARKEDWRDMAGTTAISIADYTAGIANGTIVVDEIYGEHGFVHMAIYRDAEGVRSPQRSFIKITEIEESKLAHDEKVEILGISLGREINHFGDKKRYKRRRNQWKVWKTPQARVAG